MARKRCSKAFLELLDPIRDSLYGYAYRAVWHKDQAADVVQEALMAGWRGFGRFEPGTNFRAWMFRILVNTIYRFNKKSTRRREVALEDKTMDANAVLEREDAWSQLLENPDMLTQLLDERLVRSLDRLGDDERQCLLLRLLQGFAYKEIAAMLNIPLGTVMSHVHRARLKLRKELASLAVEHGLFEEAV